MDIFLSYSWSCEALASRIESMVSEEPAFHILRDIHLINTAERIHTFMDSIRTVSCAIVILNGNYLYSENCLYELITFSKELDFTSRIIPIEITGTKFFSRDIQREVTEYWKIRYQYNDSLLFEPNELRRTIEVISDLKCIVCDLSNEDSINSCVRSVLHAIFQHVFRCELQLENTNKYQALAYGFPATGRRFFYVLWKFYRVDFQNQLFMSKQVELHSSFEN